MPKHPLSKAPGALTPSQIRCHGFVPIGTNDCSREPSPQFDTKPKREGHLERSRLLELLVEHQRHIHALLGEGEAAINSTDQARAKTLALIRWQMMRRLRAYQLFKHTELFGPAIRGNDSQRAKLAEGMKARCTGIGETYSAHVGKWSAGGIESDWSNYKADAADITRSIQNHLTRELSEAEQLIPAYLRSISSAQSAQAPQILTREG